MSILSSREDFMNRINTLAGDRNDDDVLQIIQDMSETFDSFNRDIPNVEEINSQWQTKMNTLENEWRDRYKNAFLHNGTNKDDNEDIDNHEPDENPNNIKTFGELFK